METNGLKIPFFSQKAAALLADHETITRVILGHGSPEVLSSHSFLNNSWRQILLKLPSNYVTPLYRLEVGAGISYATPKER